MARKPRKIEDMDEVILRAMEKIRDMSTDDMTKMVRKFKDPKIARMICDVRQFWRIRELFDITETLCDKIESLERRLERVERRLGLG